MQDKLVKKHQENLEVLREEIKGRKEEILSNINIDDLMMNPKLYLDTLAKEFYESNTDKFEKAIKLGKDLSTDMLKEVNNNDTSEIQDAEIQLKQAEDSTDIE
jgi:hypothetical protein